MQLIADDAVKEGAIGKDCCMVMYMYRKSNHSNQVSDFIFNKYS